MSENLPKGKLMNWLLSFIQRLICRHRHQIIKRNLGQAWWECTTCFRVKPIPPILTGSPKGAFTPRALHVSNAVYHAWKVRQNILSEKAQAELEDWYREQDEERQPSRPCELPRSSEPLP